MCWPAVRLHFSGFWGIITPTPPLPRPRDVYKRQAESKGQNVHLSVLEQDGSGGWSIAYEVMGLSTEAVSYTHLDVYKRQS